MLELQLLLLPVLPVGEPATAARAAAGREGETKGAAAGTTPDMEVWQNLEGAEETVQDGEGAVGVAAGGTGDLEPGAAVGAGRGCRAPLPSPLSTVDDQRLLILTPYETD